MLMTEENRADKRHTSSEEVSFASKSKEGQVLQVCCYLESNKLTHLLVLGKSLGFCKRGLSLPR